MLKIVVDSSVIAKWLSQQDEERTAQADRILRNAQEGKVTLLAPELAKYEIGNAILLHKEISIEEAETIFNDLFLFPIQFIDQTEELANVTYSIAKKVRITYYDASFLALAKQENAILITDNPKHQAKQLDVKVIPLRDY